MYSQGMREQYCGKCGADLTCPDCGDRSDAPLLDTTCPNCGAFHQKDNYCRACGRPMPRSCPKCRGTGRVLSHKCKGRVGRDRGDSEQSPLHQAPWINWSRPSFLDDSRRPKIRLRNTSVRDITDRDTPEIFQPHSMRPTLGEPSIRPPFADSDGPISGTIRRSSRSTSDDGCGIGAAILVVLVLLVVAFALWPWLQRMGLF